jgi:GntR family transcriptional regulator
MMEIARPDRRTLADRTALAIRDAMEQGSYPPGSQLPPENDFANMLDVSRTTLREALRKLEEQGLIFRRRGKGTFVARPSIEKDLSKNFGITEMIALAGFEPGTSETAIRVERAQRGLAAELEIPEGEQVLVVERVRTADMEPVVWTVDIVPTRLFGSRDPKDGLKELGSLYDYLQHELGLRLLHGRATLRPAAATSEVAEKLNIDEGTPILLITQTDYDEDDRPVSHSIEYHLADKFVFVVQRKGPSL